MQVQYLDKLKPGITTNWDAKIRQDLLAELKTEGIIIDKLSDKEVVEQVSSWLMRRSKRCERRVTTLGIVYGSGTSTSEGRISGVCVSQVIAAPG